MKNQITITQKLEQKVYDIVASIPAGKVATYGQVAELAGISGAAQEVGSIMSHVRPELKLPCHRVVNKTGVLSPDYAFGGQEQQRSLLEQEGVRFLNNGRINMEYSQWGGMEQLSLF